MMLEEPNYPLFLCTLQFIHLVINPFLNVRRVVCNETLLNRFVNSCTSFTRRVKGNHLFNMILLYTTYTHTFLGILYRHCNELNIFFLPNQQYCYACMSCLVCLQFFSEEIKNVMKSKIALLH